MEFIARKVTVGEPPGSVQNNLSLLLLRLWMASGASERQRKNHQIMAGDGAEMGWGQGRYMHTVKILIMGDHERASAPFVQQEAYYYLG